MLGVTPPDLVRQHARCVASAAGIMQRQAGPRPPWHLIPPLLALTPGVLFVETSSLTGENASTPFLLAARAILEQIDAGTIDPDVAGSGVSYGERQLRAVGSSGRLNSGSGFTPWRRRRRDSISIREMVGSGSRCNC